MQYLFLFAVVWLASCQKNPDQQEVDEIFLHKQRPAGNQEVLFKQKTDTLPPKQPPSDIITPISDDSNILTIQQIRQRAKMQQNSQTTNTYSQTTVIPSPNTEVTQEIAISSNIANQTTQIDNSTIDVEIPKKTEEPLEVTPKSVPVVQSHSQNNTMELQQSSFEVQAGAFRNYDSAIQIVEKFRNIKNAKPRIETHNGIHKVKISSTKTLTTKDEAHTFIQTLIDATQHYDIMIVKI